MLCNSWCMWLSNYYFGRIVMYATFSFNSRFSLGSVVGLDGDPSFIPDDFLRLWLKKLPQANPITNIKADITPRTQVTDISAILSVIELVAASIRQGTGVPVGWNNLNLYQYQDHHVKRVQTIATICRGKLIYSTAYTKINVMHCH